MWEEEYTTMPTKPKSKCRGGCHFKVGDKVVCITPDLIGKLKINEEYVIRDGMVDTFHLVFVTTTSGVELAEAFYCTRFELVNRAHFSTNQLMSNKSHPRCGYCRKELLPEADAYYGKNPELSNLCFSCRVKTTGIRA